jgi:hypothetical protein
MHQDPHLDPTNNSHIIRSHTPFADKLNPRRLDYSPKMAALIGTIIGHDYGALDPSGDKLTGLSITSDDFLVASSTSHESGAFIGTAADFERNLRQFLADANLTAEERQEFDRLYRANVCDWRTR